MASISRMDRSSSTTRMRGERRSAGVSVAVAFMSLCHHRGPCRQVHGHGRAAARLRADLNLAVVIGHDAMHDRQPKAAALAESPVKRLKEAVEFLGLNADALVLHGDHDAVGGCVVPPNQFQATSL